MSHRVVSGLKWARLSESGPELPQRRARGAKAAGLRYERAFAKALPQARHGQWVEFEDLNGHGWCQPDFIAEASGKVVVIETKYTWTILGHTQLDLLYLPVLRRALERECVGLVACRNLTQTSPKVVDNLGEAIALAKRGRSVLHWLGVGPLFGGESVAPLSLGPPPPLPSLEQLELEL